MTPVLKSVYNYLIFLPFFLDIFGTMAKIYQIPQNSMEITDTCDIGNFVVYASAAFFV